LESELNATMVFKTDGNTTLTHSHSIMNDDMAYGQSLKQATDYNC